VLGTEHVAIVVETGFGAGAEIDGAEDETNRAGIDPIEVDGRVQQLAQLRRLDRTPLGCRPPGQGWCGVAFRGVPGDPATDPARDPALAASRGMPAQLPPEPAQPRHPLMRQVARDDRGIECADRRAGDPVRAHPGMFERGVCPRLISAETAAARQNQRDPVETGQAFFGSRARQNPLPRAAPDVARTNGAVARSRAVNLCSLFPPLPPTALDRGKYRSANIIRSRIEPSNPETLDGSFLLRSGHRRH
jgi:hypothetical protein